MLWWPAFTGHNAVDKVAILPRGGAGGYTRFMPDERSSIPV